MFKGFQPRRPSLIVTGAPIGVSKRQAFLLNNDLKPVSPSLRTWHALSYVNFWVADGFNMWVYCSKNGWTPEMPEHDDDADDRQPY